MGNWKKTMLGAPAGGGTDVIFMSVGSGLVSIDVTTPSSPSVIDYQSGYGNAFCATDNDQSEYLFTYLGGYLYEMTTDFSTINYLQGPSGVNGLEHGVVDMVNQFLVTGSSGETKIWLFDLNSDGSVSSLNSTVENWGKVTFDLDVRRNATHGGYLVGHTNSAYFKPYPSGSSALTTSLGSYGYAVHMDQYTDNFMYSGYSSSFGPLYLYNYDQGNSDASYYINPAIGGIHTNSTGQLIVLRNGSSIIYTINVATSNTSPSYIGDYNDYSFSNMTNGSSFESGSIVDTESDILWALSGDELFAYDVSDHTSVSKIGSGYNIKTALSNPPGFGTSSSKMSFKKAFTGAL